MMIPKNFNLPGLDDELPKKKKTSLKDAFSRKKATKTQKPVAKSKEETNSRKIKNTLSTGDDFGSFQANPPEYLEVEHNERYGVDYVKIPKTQFDLEGQPIITVDIDLDDLNSGAEMFLKHLRQAPTKEEIEELRKLRIEKIRKQKEALAEIDKIEHEEDLKIQQKINESNEKFISKRKGKK